MKISFDYDDTLTMPVLEKDAIRYVPRPEYVELAKKYAAEGNEVIIVTARSNADIHQKEIKKFIKENELIIAGVYYTNHFPKGPKLKSLNVDIHYDDRQDHIDSAKYHGVKGVYVEPINPRAHLQSSILDDKKIRRC